MNQTALLILGLVASTVLIYALASCAALWLRFKSDKTPLPTSAWLLVALAGAVPLASLLIWTLFPTVNFNFFYLSWLLGIAVGLVALLLKLPRLAIGIMAGLSAGCLCAFFGSFVLAWLD